MAKFPKKTLPLKVYFVMGEQSGEDLAVDLLDAFDDMGVPVEPLGLGGDKLQKRGLDSLFDVTDLSVIGISGVIGKLPTIIKRVRQTVEDIMDKRPDVILLIDSPDFGYAVAKRVRKRKADIPIVKYICPSVWGWRPGRAPKMRVFIDHVLAILPFEPEVMKKLDGPNTTYIGHPLMRLIAKNAKRKNVIPKSPANLLVLPGSRKSEISRLLPVIRDTLSKLKERGNVFEAVLPAVDHLAEEIRASVAEWPVKPEIVTGDDARVAAFSKADAAIAASGTVTLELALFKVPMISIYKLDPVMMIARKFMYAWTASLPNLIADGAVVPEQFNEFANSNLISRQIEQLLVKGPARNAQLEGFEIVAKNMQQSERPGLIAARKILEITKS
ncbi:MAG: lipid-A-disaccharide synthase [Rhizobiaceae bacterium]